MERLKQVLSKKDPIKRAEAMCNILENEDWGSVALVPTTANFQLPEIFLSTKILPECETYFIQERTKIHENQVEEWNSRVDNVLEKLSPDFLVSSAPESKVIPTEAELVERAKDVLGYKLDD